VIDNGRESFPEHFAREGHRVGNRFLRPRGGIELNWEEPAISVPRARLHRNPQLVVPLYFLFKG
jgi:hypothetical protein